MIPTSLLFTSCQLTASDAQSYRSPCHARGQPESVDENTCWGLENPADAVGVTREIKLYTPVTELILPGYIDLNGYIVFVFG